MSWKDTNNISWSMYESHKTAYVFDENYDGPDKEKTKLIMNKKVPIKKGDQIVILYDNSKPIITKEWNGGETTIKNVLYFIEKALNENINNNNNDLITAVYKRISSWFCSKLRLELVEKFEKGKLKPKDLLGDHRYFEGMKRRGSSKFIEYSVGS
jgi:hypothetical protein